MYVYRYRPIYIYIYIYIPVYILRNAPIQKAWVYISFCSTNKVGQSCSGTRFNINLPEHRHEMYLRRSAEKKRGYQSIPLMHMLF